MLCRETGASSAPCSWSPGRKALIPGATISAEAQSFPDIEEGLGGPISGKSMRVLPFCRWEAAEGEWARDGGESGRDRARIGPTGRTNVPIRCLAVIRQVFSAP